MNFKNYMELYDEGKKRLIKALIHEYEIDARYILLHIFGIDMSDMLRDYTVQFSEQQKEKCIDYLAAIDVRATHVPLQYITQQQNFYGIDFYVDRNVLIPRQDTEILVEKVLKDNPPVTNGDKDSRRILDLCTGSGCIAVSLKKIGKYKEAFASDISADALMVADKNALNNGIEMLFYQSDMFSQLDQVKEIDILTCNPPYIRSSVVDQLMPEVKDHEPRIALDGMSDGLKFYRIIATEAQKHLNNGARVYLEIGFDQADDVKKLLLSSGFDNIEITKDLAGLDRVVSASWNY